MKLSLRKLSLSVVAVICLPLVQANAQDLPLLEIYVGGGVANSRYFDRATSPGWGLSLGLNQNQHLRWTAEISGQYESAPQIIYDDQRATFSQYQLLFGPQFVIRRSGLSPFLHTLLGVAARHVSTPSGESTVPDDVLAVDFGFASALGGGLEADLRNWLAIRVIQADYLLTHLTPQQRELSPVVGQLPQVGGWQHNVRFAAGVVLRFSED